MRPGRGSRHCRHYSRVPREAPAPIRPMVYLSAGFFWCFYRFML